MLRRIASVACSRSLVACSRSLSMSAQCRADLTEKVKESKVVVFMKGVPDAPQCGFSNAVVQIMNLHGVDNYSAHNVLADQELREGIKEFSDWPTIPQVYVDGEFIGGCDILIQMHQNGELIDVLQSVGIKSLLVGPEPKDS